MTRVYDPQAMDNARRSFPTLAYAPSALDAAHDADVVLHLTEWPQFRELDPGELGEVVRQRRIVDGRNASPQAEASAGRQGSGEVREVGVIAPSSRTSSLQ